jgi:ketosteroid isomerase-like protein
MDRAALLSIAAAYGAATRSGDGDALVALSEPDAVVWHNHDGLEVDMATTARTVAWLHRRVDGLAWVDVALLPTPTGFVWQSVLCGQAPGGPLRVHSCVVATVSERGLIARLDEYLDPTALAPLSA